MGDHIQGYQFWGRSFCEIPTLQPDLLVLVQLFEGEEPLLWDLEEVSLVALAQLAMLLCVDLHES